MTGGGETSVYFSIKLYDGKFDFQYEDNISTRKPIY